MRRRVGDLIASPTSADETEEGQLLRITEVPLNQWRLVLERAGGHIEGGNALHLAVTGTRITHLGPPDNAEPVFGQVAKAEVEDVELVHHRGVVTIRAVSPQFDDRVVPVYQLLSKSILSALDLVPRDFTPKMSKTW